MSTKLIIMAGLAVAFGGVSYVAGNSYLENQTQARLSEIENNRPAVKELNLAKVVVATQELKFGEPVTEEMLKLVDWPKDAFPEGGFTSIEDIMSDENRRAVASIQPGEPILASKLTGKNGRAGLAGLIAEGKRAVTIPVDSVKGVGGFIQPGDFVDIVLTREVEGDDEEESVAKIMMENVKVLSVDQDAGSRSSTARVASSVTLETDTKGAQKIALALNVGRLSLLLRGAGDTASGNTRELTAGNLDDQQNGDGFLSFLNSGPKTTSVKVTAGGEITTHTVEIEQPKTANNNNN